MTICSPEELIDAGVETAENRLTVTLTVCIDLRFAMERKITVDFRDRILVVRVNGNLLFKSATADASNLIAQLVYENGMLRAYDTEDNHLAEFKV